MGTRAMRLARGKGARADGASRQSKQASTFKIGDRVRFMGTHREGPSSLVNLSSMAGMAGMFCLTGRREARDAKGPWPGLRGRVVVLPEESTKKARCLETLVIVSPIILHSTWSGSALTTS